MIAKLRGILSEIPDEYHILIDVNGVFYQVLLPAYVMREVAECYQIGDEITISTLHEIESAGGFGAMSPRLIGFLSDRDRKFFERLVKVKDFGAKRALKSLNVPFNQVANAIETADIKFLTSLPEIGKRSAEKMVAELKGKMMEFVTDGESGSVSCDIDSMPDFKQDAVNALIQLGYKRFEAVRMVNHALQRDLEISQTDALIKEVFRKSE